MFNEYFVLYSTVVNSSFEDRIESIANDYTYLKN